MSKTGRRSSGLTGKQGEDAACRCLVRKGYRLLARNFRCYYGELDIVAACGDILVFAEVKTRKDCSAGLPCEAVNASKKSKLRASAQVYMKLHPELSAFQPRMDVIEVIPSEEGFYIRHIENAF